VPVDGIVPDLAQLPADEIGRQKEAKNQFRYSLAKIEGLIPLRAKSNV
jgi:hypothetical protein